ncbi:hypothetical protein SAMN05192539_100515 [Paraburkholderia diazotrophica]|uniref:Uncharacterized protein n=1 Tax=Paraburkholderia diazotrophica TaxID=667676 RepID=A0A1H6UES3_9BURK|nr:hypothetical protein SAMN05192539_100515 [Paraburkholderia diazotrophica]
MQYIARRLDLVAHEDSVHMTDNGARDAEIRVTPVHLVLCTCRPLPRDADTARKADASVDYMTAACGACCRSCDQARSGAARGTGPLPHLRHRACADSACSSSASRPRRAAHALKCLHAPSPKRDRDPLADCADQQMKVSNVMVFRALAMPSSIEGKISSPLSGTSKRVARYNKRTGQQAHRADELRIVAAYRRSTLCSIFFSPVERLASTSTTTGVTTTVSGIVSMRRVQRCSGFGRRAPKSKAVTARTRRCMRVRWRCTASALPVRIVHFLAITI